MLDVTVTSAGPASAEAPPVLVACTVYRYVPAPVESTMDITVAGTDAATVAFDQLFFLAFQDWRRTS